MDAVLELPSLRTLRVPSDKLWVTERERLKAGCAARGIELVWKLDEVGRKKPRAWNRVPLEVECGSDYEDEREMERDMRRRQGYW